MYTTVQQSLSYSDILCKTFTKLNCDQLQLRDVRSYGLIQYGSKVSYHSLARWESCLKRWHSCVVKRFKKLWVSSIFAMFTAKSLLWTALPIMRPYNRPRIPQVLKNAAVTHVWFDWTHSGNCKIALLWIVCSTIKQIIITCTC